MPITSDRELAEAVGKASQLVQEIQNYTGRALRDDAKISFPANLIGTAYSYRTRCPGYLEDRQKSSCAYGFMYLDVLWWVSSRTTLNLVAKEMVFKSAIITLGTILEAILNIPDRGIFDSNAGVALRLNRACEKTWINSEQRDQLKELWTNRNNVHLKLLDTHEFSKYRVEHVNIPHIALLHLMNALKIWFEAEQATPSSPPASARS